MTPVNRDREPLPGAPGGEIDDGWGPWRTDISEWDVTTHDVRFECIGGVHKISTRPRAPASPVIADQEAQAVDWPQGAEILAKEMQAIVAADRWKGRDLSAVPPEKWSHLRPETQQFWIDTAMRILTLIAAAQEKLHD